MMDGDGAQIEPDDVLMVPLPVDIGQQQQEPVVDVAAPELQIPDPLMPYRERQANNYYPNLTGLQDMRVILHILPYLGPKDFKPCRMICHNWNMAILFHSDKAQLGFSGRIRDKWYSQANSLNLNATLTWHTLDLYHFTYRRKATVFQTYWTNAASLLKILNLKRCSLECDGFIFLLDRCPVLETLALKFCKLRDLDDFHNDCRIIAKRRRMMNEIPDPVSPITTPLRHLSFESMNKIEQCFMDYLVRRTGHLESISISKCFVDPQKLQPGVTADPKQRDRFLEFERNIRILIQRNFGTLRKYEIKENNYQADFFGHLAGMPPITIPEFSIALLSDESSNYANVIRFMNNVRGLEKLRLEFKGVITSTPLDNILRGHRHTLRKLNLIFPGNKCGTSFSNLNINFLSDFTVLESLEVEDSKEFHEFRIRPFIGGKRPERKGRNRRFKVDGAALLKSVETNLEPTFLGSLPNTMRKLTLTKYMASFDYLGSWVDNTNIFASFRGLTKLEIRGPWVHPFRNIVQTISTELRALESLALDTCGIADEDMTDLSQTAVLQMQLSLTYGLALFTPDNSPSRQEIVDAVERGIRENIAPRRRLQDLPNLKHLDLTRGLRISDVTLFGALHMPTLKTLILDNCYRITNSGLEFLHMNCPNLEELSLKNCRRLSRLGLNQLVTRCRKLKKVFTTKAIQNDELADFEIPLNPNYGDIISIDTSPQTEGFQDED